MSESAVPLVCAQRADVIETIHRGAIAVVDVENNMVARIGDPEAVYFVRSSAKPLQAVAAAETGAFERFEYTDAQIALAASSHSGELAHVAEAKATLAKLQIGEDDLICGLSYPFYQRRRDEMIRAGERPSRLHHNCSGKHCAMIAAALSRNEDRASYWKPEHPHQQRIVHLIAEMADLTPDRIKRGVDGCGAPVHALPLRNMALAFARLTDPSALSPKRAEACRLVTSAMLRYPYLVAGSERFDTVLLANSGGKIICKSGAEGYFAAGVYLGNSSTPALGIALKIEDGNERASFQAAMEVLKQLGLLDEQRHWRLDTWYEILLRNSRGEIVGKSRPVFDLMFEKS